MFWTIWKNSISPPACVAKVTGQPPINCEYEQHAVSNWWRKCSPSQHRACRCSVWTDTHAHTHAHTSKYIPERAWAQSNTPLLLSELAAFPDFSLHEPWGCSTPESEHPLTGCEPALWLPPWLFTSSTNYHMLGHHPLCSLYLAFSPSVFIRWLNIHFTSLIMFTFSCILGASLCRKSSLNGKLWRGL